MITIYRTKIEIKNPYRRIIDLWENKEDAMSFYNGVIKNEDCISGKVEKLQNSDGVTISNIEIVAVYNDEYYHSLQFDNLIDWVLQHCETKEDKKIALKNCGFNNTQIKCIIDDYYNDDEALPFVSSGF